MKISEGFDESLWKGGVFDGAFSGQKDDDATWYVLEVDNEKVALGSAVPGPGELTTISYFVHPSHRGIGHGTALASKMASMHKNASFTIFKSNEASIKVALAALRQKFSMTMGREVVRLTKEGDERLDEIRGRVQEESFNGPFDKYHRQGILNPTALVDSDTGSVPNIRKAVIARLKKAASKKKEDEPATPTVKGPPLISYLDDVAMVLKGLRKEAPIIAKAAAGYGRECQECGQDAVQSCRCFLADSKCANGHEWHYVNGKVVPGNSHEQPKLAADKSHQNTVGTTLESKIHESFTVASDRLFRAGILNTQERIALSGAIGDMLGNFRKKMNPEVYARKMTENAHEHLKAALLRTTAERALRSRILQARNFTSGHARMRAVESAARSVQAQSATPVESKERAMLVKSLRGIKALAGGGKGGGIYRDIREAEGRNAQKELF